MANNIGDVLLKINGRHYLVPAEAIGAPLEDVDGGMIEMLDNEIRAIDPANTGVEFAIELSGADRNAIDRSARQCVRQARQCQRAARQCVRTARQCVRQAAPVAA